MNNKFSVRKLVMIAMLSAVAFALMFIDFSIPALIPSFIKMDVSELPALIGAFSMGPVAGVIIALLKNVLHIVIKGTSTACTGELANFLLACCLVVPAGAIYNKLKAPKNGESAKSAGRKAALLGCVVGTVAMAVLSVPVNYFISYPAYVKFYGLPLDAIISMYQAILPAADTLLKCLVIFNVPFNLVKCALTAVLTFLVYKRISPIIKGTK